MKRHLTIVSIPHCFWSTDLILELKFTLLWSNWENVLVWTHLCCLFLLLFTKLSNGKLVTEKSGKWESGNPLFLPQFCSHCTFESFASVLMSLKWCTFALLSLCRGYWLLISKVDVWKEIQLANCPRQGFFFGSSIFYGNVCRLMYI